MSQINNLYLSVATQTILVIICWHWECAKTSKKEKNISYISGFFLLEKRIRFHFALPAVGLRAEVARRWWLSSWWRDPPWAWFSLITSTDRYRDMCIHTCTMPTDTHRYQRSFSGSALITGTLLSLTHCRAKRGFNKTWGDVENTSETSVFSKRTEGWQWRGSAPPLTSCEQNTWFTLHH